MKKLIAILAVFAVVAGAAFAQDEGSWSVGGNGQIGSRLQLEPLGTEGGHVELKASGFNTWEGVGDVRASLDVMYNKGGLSTGFGINQAGGITAKLSFNGDNFQFGAEQNLRDVIGLFSGIYVDNYDYTADSENRLPDGASATPSADGLGWTITPSSGDPYFIPFFGNSFFGGGRGRLWGNYTFDVLNGLKLEAAVNKEQGDLFNATGIFGDTYTHHAVIGRNYLLLDVSPMDGLNVGFITPDVFALGGADFLTKSLQKTVFGAKYSSGPLGAALQFALLGAQPPYMKKGEAAKINTSDDLKSALYLGATYQINDQMSAGLEFRGTFGGGQKEDKDGNYSDTVGIKFGASFSFNDGPFGAGITIKFEDNDADAKYYGVVNSIPGVIVEAYDHNQTFSIDANVSFDLVENYLKFIFEAGFTFKEAIEKTEVSGSDTKAVYAGVIDYSFAPQLFFNFLGTGTGNYWGLNTGMGLKYLAEGPAKYFEPTKGHNNTNYLQIFFKWSF